jgi:hypothetical protein
MGSGSLGFVPSELGAVWEMFQIFLLELVEHVITSSRN